MGYILWITTELQQYSKIKYTTFCKSFSHDNDSNVWGIKKAFWPNKQGHTASRLQAAANARFRVTNNTVGSKGGEKKEEDEYCLVTSLCCIKYLQAFNHHIAIPIYWGTLYHLSLGSARKLCQISEISPRCQSQNVTVLYQIRCQLCSRVNLCLSWFAAKTKINCKSLEQCYWTNSAFEMNALYLSVICEKINLCIMK